MPDYRYIALALAVAVGITVLLRALPFVAKAAIKDSQILTDVGRWLPLGAVTILTVYCLARIDYSSSAQAAGPLVGVAVTAGVHVRWRNIVLSIVVGTTACILITNLT